MLIRINPRGLKFQLFDYSIKGQTQIVYEGKELIVNLSLDEMNKNWYQWQIKGKYIQDAFPELSADEREFLMTGITPEEWDEMFKEQEK